LKLGHGYSRKSGWIEESLTPTRLGDTNTTVRLAVLDGNAIKPWYKDSPHQWAMSQLNIREYHLKYEADACYKDVTDSIKKAKSTMRDRGKWSVLVPLTGAGDDLWRGFGLDKDERTVTVEYSSHKGLTVTKEE
jgi:CRISPR-associated endonuclease/helicase Cas3